MTCTKFSQQACRSLGLSHCLAAQSSDGGVRSLLCPCSANVTHFDLKSGNVLLTAEHTAKVADVGLSR